MWAETSAKTGEGVTDIFHALGMTPCFPSHIDVCVTYWSIVYSEEAAFSCPSAERTRRCGWSCWRFCTWSTSRSGPQQGCKCSQGWPRWLQLLSSPIVPDSPRRHSPDKRHDIARPGRLLATPMRHPAFRCSRLCIITDLFRHCTLFIL